MAILTDQDTSFIQKLKAQGYSKEDAFAALAQVKQAKGDKTFTFGERFMQNLKKAPEALFGAGSLTGETLGKIPLVSNAVNAVKDTAESAVSGVSNIASGLGEIKQGLDVKPASQGENPFNPFTNQYTPEQQAQRITDVSGGAAKTIGGGLETAFAAPVAAATNLPVVGGLTEKALGALGGGVDVVAKGVGDALGTDQAGKDAIRQHVNNLAVLLGAKYGPEAATKLTETLKPFAAQISEGVKADFPNATQAVTDLGNKFQEGFQKGQEGGFKELNPLTDNARVQKTIDARTQAFEDLGGRYVSVSNALEHAKSKGFDVIDALAKDDRFIPEVNADGTVDSSMAIKKLNDFVRPIAEAERAAIIKEGVRVSFDEFQANALKSIEKYAERGASYDAMKARILKDLEVYKRKFVDANGTIDLAKLDDIKNAKYKISNWMDEDAQIADKTVARTAINTIVDNVKNADIRTLNQDMAKYYSARDFLDAIDNRKVKGGRLGGYFARGVGAVAGSQFGFLGSIAGAEAGGWLQSALQKGNFKSMLGKDTGVTKTPQSLVDVQKSLTEPNKQLPAGQSRSEASQQEVKNPSNAAMNNPIQETLPPSSGKSTFNTAGAAKSASLPKSKDVVKLGESKTSTTKDYRIQHQISDGVPASDLTNLVDIVKEHKSKNGYLTNYDLADLKKLEKMQGNPELDVKIYRASPVNELNAGDWVTTSKTYAGDIKKQNGGKVYEYTVKAKELIYPKNIDELPSLARFSAFKYIPSK